MDNFIKPKITKRRYPIILDAGPCGVKWQQHEGILSIGENELGFTCVCGESALGSESVIHNSNCINPNINF
jgi:hypothetical protein